MPCYDPHRVLRRSNGELDWRHTLSATRGTLAPGEHVATIPCGKCIGCKAAGAKDFSVRCYHESLSHTRYWQDPETRKTSEIPNSVVLTLTYDQDHLPADGLLDHSTFQRFLKRLAFHRGSSPRFFMCGEYGGKSLRPHFHAVLFGVDFDDRHKVQLSDGQVVEMSPELDSYWSDRNGRIGFATLDDFSFEGAGYVAGYVAKKMVETFDPRRMIVVTDEVTGESKYVDPGPEYRQMSRNPGLGRAWIEDHLDEVYPADVVRIGPYKFKPPTYYDTVLKRLDPELHREVLENRLAGEAEYGQAWTPERAGSALKIYMNEKNATRRKDAL